MLTKLNFLLFQPGLLTRFQPELDLILRTAIWNYSVRTQLATFGQQLLFICYNPDQLTRSRLSLHFVTTVLLEYLRDVSTYRASHVEWLQRTTSWADSAIGVGHFVNIFRFLSTGKKPNLVDWILRLDHISMHGNRRRDVGYTNMTRELIWGGFMVDFKTQNISFFFNIINLFVCFFSRNSWDSLCR